MTQGAKQRKKWVYKLRNKYKLVILNDETFEEKLSFRLSRMNVFVFTGTLTILLIALTTILIAFTPLREYIPGYTDVSLYERLYRLEGLTDSLQNAVRQRDLYMNNLKTILEGNDTSYRVSQTVETAGKYSEVDFTRSREDSMLRADFESYNLGENYSNPPEQRHETRSSTSSISNFSFFTPLRGIVTNKFNPLEKHFGIDIVSGRNEAIKATLDGVVTFAGWTVETGYVITIQHSHDLISVYKHNSALLKEQGSSVKAGDPIAIIGSSGDQTTGPHLHFELWYNGVPVNPADFMTF